MPSASHQKYVAVLQHLVAFAEGDTSAIPVPLLETGDGLISSNHVTNDHLVRTTPRERDVIRAELQLFLRGVANGHAHMLTPMQVRIEMTTHPRSTPVSKRRQQRGARSVSWLIEAKARDWVFWLVDHVLPRVELEILRPCPGCGRPFVRVTRKRFCSARCQSRSYMREWRAPK